MKSTSGTQYHVVFVRDKDVCLAVPGHLAVQAGDEITFHSAGAGKISVMFPVAVLKNQAGGPVDRHEVDPEVREATPLKVDDKRKPGCYTYVAYCHDGGRFAVGGSEPKIIIYR